MLCCVTLVFEKFIFEGCVRAGGGERVCGGKAWPGGCYCSVSDRCSAGILCMYRIRLVEDGDDDDDDGGEESRIEEGA